MARSGGLDRRTFLYGSALTAGAVTLGACSSSSGSGGSGAKPDAKARRGGSGKGSETKPLPAPAKFQESPTLAARVKSGDLPALEKRLPQEPYVVPHRWLEPGKYGGNLLLAVPTANDLQIRQYMYGHSLLRFVNDGLDIVPGLVASWESNADASEWTLHFRSGLKWSDGQPWTTADIMFWWEDMVLNQEHPDIPPDEAKSGKGTIMKLTAPDERTLVMKFDAPAPLTAARLAGYVNRGNGTTWMEPKHYLKQFHPRYNKAVSKNWATADGEFEKKRDYSSNPQSPTMTGWRLKSYRDGHQAIWERNPYYWCVDKDGRQLPNIDTLTFSVVDDPEVARLQMQEGKLDYVHGPFNGLTLADVSGFKKSEQRSSLDVLLWDGGSGTGSMFFFNYDHKEAPMRALIREPKFRQALSLAAKRDEMQKSIYFNTGEQTTGTLSPKAIEYQVNDQGKQVYHNWRDSFVKYDPEKAKKLLDQIGVVDKDSDGKREMPDGSKLKIRIDYPADTTKDHQQKNNFLKRDWEAIGLTVTLNPIPPDAFGDEWASGSLDSQAAWEVGNGPDHFAQPAWLLPIEPTRWAPLEGQYFALRGTPQEHQQQNVDPFKRTPPRMEPDPKGPIAKMWKLYDQSKLEPDAVKRRQLAWEIDKIHVTDGPFFMGTVANTPQLVLAHKDLRNVPRKENLALGGFVNPWQHPSPAVYDPEAYFWANPDQHS
ncbi:ABC transporter substrate-binding protein [Actinopolymorpha rutila]|uniref:Peptide/nickel transport system substrate-binding protein n=1 Tax=Actinopolymorpha rutila TaxID=446787 RepID=A0A852ZI80_9ACTN|nr:ABC transporter substrate-binding protein [Actinopolymorpha rutila]NYH92821.1 peptide/nickel transport system substrate-binding protein [Actinopolymorpha rutila]